jgi:micrococcal nuclease
MKNRKRFIIVIVLAALSVCAATAYKFNIELPRFEEITPAELPAYQVVGIISGNTIVIDVNSQRIKVKMTGITPAEKYSGQSATFTKNLLRGENICIVKDPNRNEPNNTEMMAGYVYRAPDGLFVNAEIIRQGYARADKATIFKYSAEFQKLENFARERGKGLWSASEAANRTEPNNTSPTTQNKTPYAKTSATPKAPQNTTAAKDIVYVTKTGKKYHRSGCSFLSKSSIPIQLEDAKAKGYTSCSKCCKE